MASFNRQLDFSIPYFETAGSGSTLGVFGSTLGVFGSTLGVLQKCVKMSIKENGTINGNFPQKLSKQKTLGNSPSENCERLEHKEVSRPKG